MLCCAVNAGACAPVVCCGAVAVVRTGSLLVSLRRSCHARENKSEGSKWRQRSAVS
jgi:hypothetical protein